MPYDPDFSTELDPERRSRRQTTSYIETHGNSYLLTDLLPSTKYEIQVASMNEAGRRSPPAYITSFTKPADHKCKEGLFFFMCVFCLFVCLFVCLFFASIYVFSTYIISTIYN